MTAEDPSPESVLGPSHGRPTEVRPRGLVLLLSGPNLGLLGERNPAVYGKQTLEDHVRSARKRASALGLEIEHSQHDHEGSLVEAVHSARGRADAIVLNAGALTHYSWALHDALDVFDGPVVELHLSNPAAREPYRHVSVVASVADGTIAGFGGLGYELAVDAVASLLARRGGKGSSGARIPDASRITDEQG